MNQYEVTVLIHPDLEADLEKATTKVEKILDNAGAKNLNKDVWGKKKLAYTIVKQDFAVYIAYTVDLPADGVKKVNDTLNITDEVMRFLIVKVDKKAVEKADKLRAEKAAKNANRPEGIRDEDDRDSRDRDEE